MVERTPVLNVVTQILLFLGLMASVVPMAAIVIAATHLSGYERYSWLNDVVCVGTGEFRPREGPVEARRVVGAAVDFVIDVAEVVWEPIP